MSRFFFRTTTNSKPMNPKQNTIPTATSCHAPRRPRLERRNAAKHFDYDASTSSSSSAATHATSLVSTLDDSNGSLHTRSLDIDLQTSFRVEGSEGEIEFIFKNLGLSGIEDFSIPVDAWDSRKIRSVSDVLPLSRLIWEDSFREENVKETEKEEEEEEEKEKERVGGEEVVVRDELVRARVLTELTGARGGRPVENSGRIDVLEFRSRERNELGGGMNGIRGSRPPMLRPPPSMRLPVIDDTRSTWDLLQDFAPSENGDLDTCDDARFVSSSDEEEEDKVVAVESKVERIMAEPEENRGIRVGETQVLSTSCSSSTSSDDESPSGPYNASPSMRGMKTISYWEKGQLLGRGSFGSVYEGIAE